MQLTCSQRMRDGVQMFAGGGWGGRKAGVYNEPVEQEYQFMKREERGSSSSSSSPLLCIAAALAFNVTGGKCSNLWGALRGLRRRREEKEYEEGEERRGEERRGGLTHREKTG
ncbi:hypothetical protein EYF80_040182 [Liparis tanakae]|uniref:Uncharacterized protein n=1 Tax=Liparis tanakae TaxID=230148 RepID=A0A4Z2G9V7_9TELE|nr:hypothetical protein EYF80_040182 [Liparis tanakae]